MVVAESKKPVSVSPLIKCGRWSMLVLGIYYGLYHQRRLSKKEAIFRQAEAKRKVIRDAQLAEEKRLAAEAETLALDILSGKRHS